MTIRYSPRVYRAQGSTKYVVASGGEIEVESGGYVSVESGGVLNIESGGAGQIGGTAALPDANGYVYPVNGIRLPLATASSTAAALSTGGGVTFLSCTSNIEYTLPAVVAGMPGLTKRLIKTSATTTVLAIVNQPSSTLFWNGANDLLSLAANYQAVTVMAGTTATGVWWYLGGLDTTACFGAST